MLLPWWQWRHWINVKNLAFPGIVCSQMCLNDIGNIHISWKLFWCWTLLSEWKFDIKLYLCLILKNLNKVGVTKNVCTPLYFNLSFSFLPIRCWIYMSKILSEQNLQRSYENNFKEKYVLLMFRNAPMGKNVFFCTS